MLMRRLLALAALASLSPVSAQQAREHWIATWGTAQQLAVETQPSWVEPPPRDAQTGPPPPSPIPPFPASFRDETLRMIARASLGGRRIRITLSNALGMKPLRVGGVHVALRQRESEIVAGSDRSATFGGRTSLHGFSLARSSSSDPIELAVPVLGELAVSLYLPEDTGTPTTHALALNTTYVARGNAVADTSMSGAATNRTYFWLAGVEVLVASQRRNDRRVRRLDYGWFLDDARYASRVAVHAGGQARGRPWPGALGGRELGHLRQPRAARRGRYQRARPLRPATCSRARA